MGERSVSPVYFVCFLVILVAYSQFGLFPFNWSGDDNLDANDTPDIIHNYLILIVEFPPSFDGRRICLMEGEEYFDWRDVRSSAEHGYIHSWD